MKVKRKIVGEPAVHPPLSLATRSLNYIRLETVNLQYTAAKDMNKDLITRFKRKTSDLEINLESLKKRPRLDRPHYTQASPMPDHQLQIELKWTDLILPCPPALTKFAKQTGGGVDLDCSMRHLSPNLMMTPTDVRYALAPGPITVSLKTTEDRGSVSS